MFTIPQTKRVMVDLTREVCIIIEALKTHTHDPAYCETAYYKLNLLMEILDRQDPETLASETLDMHLKNAIYYLDRLRVDNAFLIPDADLFILTDPLDINDPYPDYIPLVN